jgi:hypothetical protein
MLTSPVRGRRFCELYAGRDGETRRALNGEVVEPGLTRIFAGRA